MEFTNLGTSKKPKIYSLKELAYGFLKQARNVYEKEGKNHYWQTSV